MHCRTHVSLLLGLQRAHPGKAVADEAVPQHSVPHNPTPHNRQLSGRNQPQARPAAPDALLLAAVAAALLLLCSGAVSPWAAARHEVHAQHLVRLAPHRHVHVGPLHDTQSNNTAQHSNDSSAAATGFQIHGTCARRCSYWAHSGLLHCTACAHAHMSAYHADPQARLAQPNVRACSPVVSAHLFQQDTKQPNNSPGLTPTHHDLVPAQVSLQHLKLLSRQRHPLGLHLRDGQRLTAARKPVHLLC